MTVIISPARPEDRIKSAELIADTMAGFGVAVLGLGNRELEIKALEKWFVDEGNRFSYEHAFLARLDGEIAGLILCFQGDSLTRLDLGCARRMFSIYGFTGALRMVWRNKVLGLAKEAEQDEFLIAHVAVFPQFRRQGIAQKLMEWAISEAKAKGLSKLTLEVEIGNTPAIQLYERTGFSIHQTTEFGARANLLACPGFHKMVMSC
jgi:ribosomal protein S18 acetylase RimI-like enzyme